MTRTYYIRYRSPVPPYGEWKYDKVKHTSPEDRPNWHKVEALNEWKKNNPGHSRMTISSVLTISEYKKEAQQ